MRHLLSFIITGIEKRIARRSLAATTLAAAALATGIPFEIKLPADISSAKPGLMALGNPALAGRRGRGRDSDRGETRDRFESNDSGNGFSSSGPTSSSSNSSSLNSAAPNTAASPQNPSGPDSPGTPNTRPGDNSGGRWQGPNDTNSGGGNNGPPRTLADMIESWSKPSPAGTEQGKAPRQSEKPGHGHVDRGNADRGHRHKPLARERRNKRDDDKPPSAVSKASPGILRPEVPSPGAVSPSSSATARRSPGAPLSAGAWSGEIGHGNHSSSEILAVRLSPKSIDTLTGLGFTIPPQPKSESGITRVYVPEGLNATEAKELLRKELPKDKFELNRLYRIYRAANRVSSGSAYGVVPASTKPVCTGNRCLSRDILGWSPEHLRGCSAGVAVGILDTGIDHEHPALKHRSSGVFVPEGRAPAPSWHGTAVFALLAGNQRSGTPGLIPNAEIYHASIFFSDHSGEFATDTAVILQALDWMEKMDVKIVNMSFAGPRDKLVEQAIKRLSAKGMIFVAAAGNEGPGAEPAYPAAYREVIAVTAIKPDRRIYPYANRGRHIDVAAPGVDVWSAVPQAREGYYTGTSFAAPFVTALVATVYKSNPASAKDRLLSRFEYDDLGIPGRDSTYGRGLPAAPKSCTPTPHIVSGPAAAPSAWGTTTINVSPSSAPSLSAGFRP